MGVGEKKPDFMWLTLGQLHILIFALLWPQNTLSFFRYSDSSRRSRHSDNTTWDLAEA